MCWSCHLDKPDQIYIHDLTNESRICFSLRLLVAILQSKKLDSADEVYLFELCKCYKQMFIELIALF